MLSKISPFPGWLNICTVRSCSSVHGVSAVEQKLCARCVCCGTEAALCRGSMTGSKCTTLLAAAVLLPEGVMASLSVSTAESTEICSFVFALQVSAQHHQRLVLLHDLVDACLPDDLASWGV